MKMAKKKAHVKTEPKKTPHWSVDTVNVFLYSY